MFELKVFLFFLKFKKHKVLCIKWIILLLFMDKCFSLFTGSCISKLLSLEKDNRILKAWRSEPPLPLPTELRKLRLDLHSTLNSWESPRDLGGYRLSFLCKHCSCDQLIETSVWVSNLFYFFAAINFSCQVTLWQ